MSLIAEFIAHTTPRGSTRPRFGNGRAFKNPAAVQTQAVIAEAAGVALEGVPLIDEPVRLVVRAYQQRPKRLMRRRDPEGPVLWVGTPDADNVAKHVMDGLKAFWRDDALVCELHVSKRYHGKMGRPRIEVELHRVEEWANGTKSTARVGLQRFIEGPLPQGREGQRIVINGRGPYPKSPWWLEVEELEWTLAGMDERERAWPPTDCWCDEEGRVYEVGATGYRYMLDWQGDAEQEQADA